MLQRLLWVTILAAIIGWIVLSYLPAALAALPTIAFTGQGGSLAALAVVSLIVFIAIQVWLVRATVVAVRGYRPTPGEAAPARPHLTAEVLWTALPIAFTLVTAWASYGLWSRLFVS